MEDRSTQDAVKDSSQQDLANKPDDLQASHNNDNLKDQSEVEVDEPFPSEEGQKKKHKLNNLQKIYQSKDQSYIIQALKSRNKELMRQLEEKDRIIE